jgi:hypothetical protein
MMERPIGIGEGLEVGDELIGLIPAPEKKAGPVDLLIERKSFRDPCTGPRSLPIAVEATPARQGPVPIGAAEARIQGNLLDPFPEDLS